MRPALLRRAPDAPPADDVAAVRRQLERLDPWSFWVAEVSVEDPGDLAIAGVTGGFLIGLCIDDGYLEVDGLRARVGGRALPLGRLRRGGRRLQNRFNAAEVYADVEAIMCLTRAVAGGPRPIRGVTIVPLKHLASYVADRKRILIPDRAKKAAEAIGAPTGARPGDTG
jgi:hypothetical protein